jgi:hypothetical protein
MFDLDILKIDVSQETHDGVRLGPRTRYSCTWTELWAFSQAKHVLAFTPDIKQIKYEGSTGFAIFYYQYTRAGSMLERYDNYKPSAVSGTCYTSGCTNLEIVT